MTCAAIFKIERTSPARADYAKRQINRESSGRKRKFRLRASEKRSARFANVRKIPNGRAASIPYLGERDHGIAKGNDDQSVQLLYLSPCSPGIRWGIYDAQVRRI
jgi:hypothetical protein